MCEGLGEGKESTMNKQCVEQKWKAFCLHTGI